jgi:hypothetical protein
MLDISGSGSQTHGMVLMLSWAGNLREWSLLQLLEKEEDECEEENQQDLGAEERSLCQLVLLHWTADFQSVPRSLYLFWS